LLVGSKENGRDVNEDKVKYMVMSRHQIAGRSYNIKTDSNSYERVGDFKYSGRTLKNQNSVQEEIKSSLKSGNACYHLAQNLSSSSLLSKNLRSRYREL